MTFASKLLLSLSGTVLVAASVMIAVTGGRTERLLEKQLVARLQDNASHMTEKLDMFFFQRFLSARPLLAEKALHAGAAAPEEAARQLQEFLRWHSEYLSAAFYTMDWEAVADTARRPGGGKEALEDCRTALATGSGVAVCVGRNSPEEEPLIRLALVARDEAAARGVVVLRLPMTVFGVNLRETRTFGAANEKLHIDLLDHSGRYLYSNHRVGVMLETSPDWPYVRKEQLAGAAAGFMRYTNPAEETGEEILVYASEQGFREFAGSAWTLVLFAPTETVFAPVRELRVRIVAAVLVVGILLLLALFRLVRVFTRPLEELDRASREIGRGNLEVRVPVGSRDELGQFAGTFNRMAADLQESQRALAAVNRELEGKIEERTAELLHTNTLLHAELSERVRVQEELAVRERLLRLGADLGDTLTLGKPLEATLRLCTEVIVRDLEVAFVRIWLFGDEEGILELKASAGMYTRLDGEHSRKIVGKEKVGIIAQEQRPILTNAVLEDPHIVDHDWARQEGMVAFAGYPLVVDGKTAGVLALFSRRPLEPFVLVALESAAQKIAAFIGRKQVEEALRFSEQRYRELFDTASDGIYKTDARGVFTVMNRAGARIFGHEKPEEIIGRPALEYWRDPADRQRLRRDLEREKSVSSWRIPARTKSGEFRELETSSRILEGADGEFLGIEGVLRDVTQRVRIEAERDLMLAQLQEAAANIKTLTGLLPICAGCKKIRDDEGRWSPVESYVSSRSDAVFSHGLCPDCQKVYFPSITGKS